MTEEIKARVFRHIEDLLEDSFRFFQLYIYGVEVTQAIQYCNAADHLTDDDDIGPDNSIRLVADKPAYVRVYVRRRGSPLPGVTGTVTLQRRHFGLWVDAGALAQQFPPVSVTAETSPAYATERGQINSSLNFLIPASIMRGVMRLKIHVEAPGTEESADTEVEVDASLLQTLRMRGIPVRYWGSDAAGNQIRLDAPTLADFQSTAATTLLMYPVSYIPDIGLAGIFTWSVPLTGNITVNNGRAQCPTSWRDLLWSLGIAKLIDGNRADRLYYALLPSGIPIGGAGGCGGGGSVGAGFINDGQGMAHELGHVLGLGHAPCNLVNGDNGDQNYPAYEPYDTDVNKRASIGEYGFDPTTQSIYSPNNTRDFMSYCRPFWISPYHYDKLIQHNLLDPRWVAAPEDSLPPYYEERFYDPIPHDLPDPPPPWVGRSVHARAQPEPIPLVVIVGVMAEDRIEIRNVLRIRTGPVTVGRPLPDTMVELLDEQGQVILRAPVMQVNLFASCGCGCSDDTESESTSGLVQALLPDQDDFHAIRLVREGQELWLRRAASESPRIDHFSVELEGRDLQVRWRAFTSGEYPAERILRWSADDGETWQALAVSLQEDEVQIPLSVLTSGVVLVQLLVSDGFHTVESEGVQVEIPPRSPQVAILWPAAGTTVKAATTIRLWGMATASNGIPIPAEALEWELDGEPVGSGNEVWVSLSESEGEHRAALRASDGNMTAESTVSFSATVSGHRPSRSSYIL